MILTARERALARLERSLGEGRSLLATAAGSGLAAAHAEAGGADLVAVYNSSRFRTAGHGSLSALLPYANANSIVLELLRDLLPVVRRTPIVVGVCATEPFLNLDRLVHELRDMGAAGVQNFPTIGLYGAEFRSDLEATGISFEREVELMRAARRAGMLTCAFAVNEDDARRMALAGVDIICPLLGVTRESGSKTALGDAAETIDRIASAARRVRDDLLVMFHGGPAASPDDVQRVLELADDVDGFFAASSVERIPVGQAIETTVRRFTELRRRRRSDAGKMLASGPDFGEPAPELPLELTPETLGEYLRQRGVVPAGGTVDVSELGGGLSNVVLGWRCGGQAGVVKQARARLRVEAEWFADVRRVLNERDAIVLLAQRLPAGSVPTITFSDDHVLAFGMELAPHDAPLWKPQLLKGKLDPDRARQAGRLMRALHDCTRDDPDLEVRFVALPLLEQNRLEPWYRTAARAHPDVEGIIEYAAERLLEVRHVLVHGDFVPKNLLLLKDGLLLLDYEVVHYGNPGYDVATFVNHMLLKGFRFPERRAGFCALAATFWDSYVDGLGLNELEFVEQESLLQLGALMLARVDGKSKVEYLVGTSGADDARRLGRWILRTRPSSLAEILERASTTVSVGALA